MVNLILLQNTTLETLGVIKEFSTIDYCVFSGMLVISVLIGVYFGCLTGGQNSVAEYLLGSKAMQTFPITMSLISR
jgi:Na+/proline symporter